MSVPMQMHDGNLPHPIKALETYFRKGGISLIQATFANSYFVHPKEVRARTPYYPNRARRSREHYPGLDKGKTGFWVGDGREVRLDYNQRAQMAWEKYTGRKLARGTGYSVRHIWGHPWNPDSFTAGWNLCYMPFWAGMLTEEQHPHRELDEAIRQASWNLYFRDDPVCEPPDFVNDPGLDLNALLADQPILILTKLSPQSARQDFEENQESHKTPTSIAERIADIRRQRHQSWSNIRKAVKALQGLEYEPFGSPNVERSAKSCVRKINSEVGITLAQIEILLAEEGH